MHFRPALLVSGKKVGGGLELEWLGYSVLIGELSLGVSASRGEWLIAWMSNIVSEKVVHVG